MGERAGQPIRMAVEGTDRDRVAGGRAGGKAGGVACGRAVRVPRQGRAAEPGLDAAIQAAPAFWTRIFLDIRPGQGVVAPLAGYPTPAVQQLAVDDDAAAGAGADDHAEYATPAGAGAVHGLAERKAVGVVRRAHLAFEQRGQVALQRVAVEHRRIRVAHLAGHRTDRARNADADAHGRGQPGLREAHEIADRAHDLGIA